jgi:hypothetical protein
MCRVCSLYRSSRKKSTLVCMCRLESKLSLLIVTKKKKKEPCLCTTCYIKIFYIIWFGLGVLLFSVVIAFSFLLQIKICII